jgi:hypothetical protein
LIRVEQETALKCVFGLLDLVKISENGTSFSEKCHLKSGKRLSIYLPQLVNIIRYSHNLEFKDFKQYILFSISDLYLKFDIRFKFFTHQLLIEIIIFKFFALL